MFDDFGGLPSFGGFQPQFGQGMFGQDPNDPRKKKQQGFNPMMFMSPIAGMFMSGHPNMGLGMISPGLGIARALGAFK